jgi:NAD(P)-dependent dehydrogenase (short-subunit alcohol dehydrogenase family)
MLDPRAPGDKPPFPQQEQPKPGLESQMRPRPDFGEESYVGHGRLVDRVALVTGGDSGIGRAVALAFAREGADVAISYLNEHEDAEETRRWVEKAGRSALLLPGDITDEKHCEAIVRKTAEEFGRLDILINNAAEQEKEVETFEELTSDKVRRAFEVNIISMFNLVRSALPLMKPGATIINTASIQAYQPSPGILEYAATKGAIVTFTKGLAQSLADRGIRVNCVAPGPVWTPLIVQSFDPEHSQKHGKGNPLGRPAQPAELAPSYVFLASDDSSYVNGEILGVTGGMPLS